MTYTIHYSDNLSYALTAEEYAAAMRFWDGNGYYDCERLNAILSPRYLCIDYSS